MKQNNIIRPTQAKVKQAIFNIFQKEILDSEFLDLFAGKGTIGLEALNRGASCVICVDNHPLIAWAIRKPPKITILKQDVFSAIRSLYQQEKKFDFIFADPPYHQNLYQKILTGITKYDILKKSGFLILEHYWKENLPDETELFKLWQKKRYGDTVLTIYRKDINPKL
ncbi:MAG: 16S rRNA (guanine(966)-N(2))-methyltransferase RsmD [bacterium]